MRRRTAMYLVGYLLCGLIISATAFACSEHASQKAQRRENRVFLYGGPNEAIYRRNIVHIPFWSAAVLHATVAVGGLIHLRRRRVDNSYVVIVIASQLLTGFLTVFCIAAESDRAFP